MCDPRYVNQVALADPTMSGSVAKAFEMIIQQQMQNQISANRGIESGAALEQGWLDGMRIIQRASANARYFTDAASRIPVDVAQGEAAIGMCIDFYGRFESEAVRIGDEASRLQFITPIGGSSISVDPIGLFRGAPNQKAAKLFIEFVLSIDGQKLWNFKVGTPGGPVKYALRRLPVRKELYAPEYTKYRSDPDVNPYLEAGLFTYHEKWTSPLFKAMCFIIRVICMDCHDEEFSAWNALLAANFPPRATAAFSNLEAVNYESAMSQIRPALANADSIQEVRLARSLGERFRKQYKEAESLAKQRK